MTDGKNLPSTTYVWSKDGSKIISLALFLPISNDKMHFPRSIVLLVIHFSLLSIGTEIIDERISICKYQYFYSKALSTYIFTRFLLCERSSDYYWLQLFFFIFWEHIDYRMLFHIIVLSISPLSFIIFQNIQAWFHDFFSFLHF